MTTIARFRVNDSFDDIFRGFFAAPAFAKTGADAPAQAGFPVDVTEDDQQYVVRAEIPGVKKDEIQVEIDGNQIAIGAEVKREADARDGDRVLRQERYFGKVQRTFALSQDVDEARAVAKYENGVLELTLPKKTVASAKRITIQ